MIELNCETDFVGKSTAFLDAYSKIMTLYSQGSLTDLEKFLQSPFDSKISM